MSSPAKSSASPTKSLSESPKQIKDVFELIDGLDNHMKNEVYTRLMSYRPSNSNSKNLMMVNKDFANIHSYTVRLSKIKPPSPKLSPKSLPKQIDQVVKTIGTLKIKDIERFSPVKEELKTIFDQTKLNTDYLNQINKYINFDQSIDESHEDYENNTDQTDFNTKLQQWVDHWDFSHSADDLKYMQEQVQKYKADVAEYYEDISEIDRKNMKSFLKLSPNVTYAEYIQKLKDLPLPLKAAIKSQHRPISKFNGYNSNSSTQSR